VSFLETIESARAFLARNGRVSLRVLQREFALDDAALDELVEELVDVQQVAAREGKMLAWMGPTSGAAPGAGLQSPSSASASPAAAAPADAERRQLTVMFCDLVDSTTLAGRLDAEDWREVVRAYQEAAVGAIERYAGHVAQYLGDGLLVYFGWPRAHEDDAERAVRAGREVLAAIARSNETLEAEHGLQLAVRVGIHTGPVVVGALGAGARSETLALGETPNVAARLQGVAAPDSVVISDTTLRLVPGMFATRDLGTPALKGVTEPIRVHAVLQPTGVRSRLDASRGRLTPFVGRQTDLGVLADAWERVVEGHGQTVLVSGEAGLGKSRLCFEFRRQLAGEPHTWLECQCSPFTAATAFHPVIELVGQALDFLPDDGPAEKLRKLAAGLGLAGFPADETLPLLAEWLGLPAAAGYTPLATSAEAKRHRTLEALTAWNLRLAALQPLVVLVEDLHWCDPSSLELLGRLMAQSATARVLLVATARPEFESPWPAREHLKPLALGRLTTRQARELIGSVGATRALSEALVEQLVARADGVPLYAEELTRSVADADAQAAIPVTLQDSLLARLDRLSSAKEVAQKASVLGREFPYALLAAVADLEEAALRDGLSRLVESELLFARGEPPAATYTFKHALVQEAAYESLLKRTRQQLHGRVVDVLEADASAEPELVARHAEAAGRADEAIAAYRRACDDARARSAWQEAARHLSQAIALLAVQPEGGERDARELPLQLTLAYSMTAARGYVREVEAAFERARALAEVAGDARALVFALNGLAVSAHNAGAIERAADLAARALANADQIGEADLRVRPACDLGLCELYRGRFASSLAHFEAALALYEPGRRQRALSYGDFSANDRDVPQLGYSALNLCVLGFPDRALSRAGEAVALARRIDSPLSLAFALLYETLVHQIRREVALQRERAAEQMALCQTHALPFWLGLARTLHAHARVAAGEREAVADLLPGLVESGGTGARGGAPGLLVIVADAQLAAGQLSEARGTAEGGLALAAQTGQHFMDAELHRLRGEIDLAGGGAIADAEMLFQRALAIASEQEAKSLELRAATSLARLWRGQGRRAEARDLLAPICGWFTEGFDTRDLIEARALLEELA
jgi:class 3 adenylate cyclase/tetratricopeptide (TPR) repeat protein